MKKMLADVNERLSFLEFPSRKDKAMYVESDDLRISQCQFCLWSCIVACMDVSLFTQRTILLVASGSYLP